MRSSRLTNRSRSRAAAIMLAPHHEPELRSIYDTVNRCTADPVKARVEVYFSKAQNLLDEAIKATRTKTQRSDAIGHNRIFQIALENGWDGLIQEHRQASLALAASAIRHHM